MDEARSYGLSKLRAPPDAELCRYFIILPCYSQLFHESWPGIAGKSMSSLWTQGRPEWPADRRICMVRKFSHLVLYCPKTIIGTYAYDQHNLGILPRHLRDAYS